jgi:hypothetical protein
MNLWLQNTPNIGQINATKKKRGESIPGSRRSRDQLKVLKVQIVDSKRLEGMGIGETEREMNKWKFRMKQVARAEAYSFNARRRDLRRRGVDAVHYGVELSATSASTSNRAT